MTLEGDSEGDCLPESGRWSWESGDTSVLAFTGPNTGEERAAERERERERKFWRVAEGPS